MNNYEEMTFEKLAELESGTILADYYDDGVRILIMRGPASITCYLGVPKNHPLAGFYYDNIPLDCHGGLTFSGEGNKKIWPDGFYWYGFDYAHLGDKSFYNLRLRISDRSDTAWTVKEVKKDIWTAVYEFKKLMKLAENIKNK